MKCVVMTIPLGGSGPHTGHQTLYRELAVQSDLLQIEPQRNLFTRAFGKGLGILKNYGHRDHSVTTAELIFDFHRKRRNCIGHLSAIEFHSHYLLAESRREDNLCGTIHFPICLWQEKNRGAFKRLGAAICFWTREFEYFENLVGKGRLHFIHHGVDTEFFQPTKEFDLKSSRRILVAGQFLRNFEMLQRVVKRLLEIDPSLQFDFLIPLGARHSQSLRQLQGAPQIRWHSGLSEVQLKEKYQNAYIHLLPMNDSGANNAVVESLACGLPVITTDVGGIRDYGGESIFPIVANNDDDAMISLVEQYLNQPAWRDEIGQRCRQFAETTLAWPLIAEKHLQVYRELSH